MHNRKLRRPVSQSAQNVLSFVIIFLVEKLHPQHIDIEALSKGAEKTSAFSAVQRNDRR